MCESACARPSYFLKNQETSRVSCVAKCPVNYFESKTDYRCYKCPVNSIRHGDAGSVSGNWTLILRRHIWFQNFSSMFILSSKSNIANVKRDTTAAQAHSFDVPTWMSATRTTLDVLIFVLARVTQSHARWYFDRFIHKRAFWLSWEKIRTQAPIASVQLDSIWTQMAKTVCQQRSSMMWLIQLWSDIIKQQSWNNLIVHSYPKIFNQCSIFVAKYVHLVMGTWLNGSVLSQVRNVSPVYCVTLDATKAIRWQAQV